MHVVRVPLGRRTYSILIGTSLIAGLDRLITPLDLGNDAFVITNSVIRRHYAALVQAALLRADISVHIESVPDAEKSKSIETATAVLAKLARWGTGRTPFIIALGGGVVGDLAGFVAAVYKRGIPYIQIPTTLLAQVDSAIGGKTALDFAQGKNLVGAFYQPRLVVSDVSVLKTLPKRQMQSALAEIIKYALIKDARFFRYLQRNIDRVIRGRPAELAYVIRQCSAVKARIVSADERETRGLRTVLNFGHTIGHAIEAAGAFRRYNHGEAVALGMLAAARISAAMRLLSPGQLDAVTQLIAGSGLPVRIRQIRLNDIIRAHYADKKFIGRRNRFVLLSRIGAAKIVDDIPLKIIREAIAGLFTYGGC